MPPITKNEMVRRFARRVSMDVYVPRYAEDSEAGDTSLGAYVRRISKCHVCMIRKDSLVQPLMQWAVARDCRCLTNPCTCWVTSAVGQFLSLARGRPSAKLRRHEPLDSCMAFEGKELIPFGFGWFSNPVVSLKRYLILPVTHSNIFPSEDTG